MKMLFKQRLFSWFDSYDIYAEDGSTLFTVEGKLSWGHCLHILDARGEHIGTVQEQREFTLFTPRYTFDCSDWEIEGNWTEWDYTVVSPSQGLVASISKELFNWTDTYVIDVPDPANALCTLMVALAIDADKCSHG